MLENISKKEQMSTEDQNNKKQLEETEVAKQNCHMVY